MPSASPTAMPEPLRAKILILSDACSRGGREDLSGPAVREVLEVHGWVIVDSKIMADDFALIRTTLDEWLAAGGCDVVFTSGGTGLGPRDVTPEATRAVIEKEIPGLSELMRAEGLKKTRRAALSRGLAGVRGGMLIVNLPGSPRGARVSLESIIDLVPHAVDIAQGRTRH
ncbi:MAG: MogA/MoaB family molybdenum cofactor biosynthesis protein [Terriglobia bacterium]